MLPVHPPGPVHRPQLALQGRFPAPSVLTKDVLQVFPSLLYKQRDFGWKRLGIKDQEHPPGAGRSTPGVTRVAGLPADEPWCPAKEGLAHPSQGRWHAVEPSQSWLGESSTLMHGNALLRCPGLLQCCYSPAFPLAGSASIALSCSFGCCLR